MFPPVSIVGPLFNMWRTLNLFDTWLGLIIPYMTFTLPIGHLDALRVLPRDPVGPRESRASTAPRRSRPSGKVIAPLAAPGMFTSAILVFIFSWNDFLFAISLTSTNIGPHRAGGDRVLHRARSSTTHRSIAAAAVVITIPIIIIVLIFQRRIVAGLTSGAVKG